MYLDLSTGHDWPVKKVIVQLVYTVDVKFEVHFWKFIESISLSPLVAQILELPCLTVQDYICDAGYRKIEKRFS